MRNVNFLFSWRWALLYTGRRPAASVVVPEGLVDGSGVEDALHERIELASEGEGEEGALDAVGAVAADQAADVAG